MSFKKNYKHCFLRTAVFSLVLEDFHLFLSILRYLHVPFSILCKFSRQILIRCCRCSLVSWWGTHLTVIFPKLRCYFKMVSPLSYNRSKRIAIKSILICESSFTKFLTPSTFCWIMAVIWRSFLDLSSNDSRSFENRWTHRALVQYETQPCP